ncbi:MAG: hypothetical protein AAGU11_00480 [Syntrophobacteraceae bacterium]
MAETGIEVVALLVAVLLWLFPPEPLRRIFGIRPANQPQPPAVRVLAHRAYFIGNPVEHFFVKVENITAGVDVEVTHIWYQNEKRVDILSRPLPVRLRSSETWETFVPTASIPEDVDVFQHFTL